ncbi:MAG: hypothetical protein V4574_09920 [Pseudomonadota bacterium]
MPRIAHLLLVFGAIALLVAWFSPQILNAPAAEGKACERSAAKEVPPTGDKFAIVNVQPVNFRREDAICVTIENVVSKTDSSEAKDEARTLRERLVVEEAERKAAEEASFTAPAADMLRAKQKVDVLAGRVDATRKQLDDLEAARARPDEVRHFNLYLNGSKSPFVADAVVKPGRQTLVFRLNDSADASSELGAFWRTAITKPIIDGKLDAQLAISDGTGPLMSYVADKEVVTRVVMYNTTVRWLSGVALLAMLAWLVVLAIHTPLLRMGDDVTSAFSLARVQMMFWLVMVSGGYLYIWFVVGQWLNVMNSATFALLGISGVAAGAALTIDGAKNQPASGIPRSRNFLYDIASDGAHNIQLQRIQMILWTLILGGIFFWSVSAKLELPPLDANLLALAGIVNGVYVALKTQEPAAPPQAPAAGAAGDSSQTGPG